MTREEAIKIIENRYSIMDYCESRELGEALDMVAIEALKQEPILNKIRAEISNINLNEVATKYGDRFYGFQREVIKILDKYNKAESEVKE